MYRAIHLALKNARSVVFLFESVAECYMRAFPGALDAKRIHIIPNGYEGGVDESEPPKGDRCTVLYSGTISTYRYDTLLESVVLLKRAHPTEAQRLRFHFVGEGSDAVMKEAVSLGISDLVETSAPLPQSAVSALQRAAHALLVLGRPPTTKGYELLAGAKLFEYIKARRPIIGVLPNDEGKKILLKFGLPTIADVDSASNIVTVLRRLLDAWSTDTLATLLPQRSVIDTYSSENQTSALVRALMGIAPVAPFVPGSLGIPPSLDGKILSNAAAASYSGWI